MGEIWTEGERFYALVAFCCEFLAPILAIGGAVMPAAQDCWKNGICAGLMHGKLIGKEVVYYKCAVNGVKSSKCLLMTHSAVHLGSEPRCVQWGGSKYQQEYAAPVCYNVICSCKELFKGYLRLEIFCFTG